VSKALKMKEGEDIKCSARWKPLWIIYPPNTEDHKKKSWIGHILTTLNMCNYRQRQNPNIFHCKSWM